MDGSKGLEALGAEARKFISSPKKILIDGAWVNSTSGQTFEIYNPATGQVVAHAQAGSKEDINAAVAAARRAFDDHSEWRKMSPSNRGKLLHKIDEALDRIEGGNFGWCEETGEPIGDGGKALLGEIRGDDGFSPAGGLAHERL